MLNHHRIPAEYRASFRCVAIAAFFFASWSCPQLASGQAKASSPSRNIGIIGSDNIGSTVGALWIEAGHHVLFSSRIRRT